MPMKLRKRWFPFSMFDPSKIFRKTSRKESHYFDFVCMRWVTFGPLCSGCMIVRPIQSEMTMKERPALWDTRNMECLSSDMSLEDEWDGEQSISTTSGSLSPFSFSMYDTLVHSVTLISVTLYLPD